MSNSYRIKSIFGVKYTSYLYAPITEGTTCRVEISSRFNQIGVSSDIEGEEEWTLPKANEESKRKRPV